MHIPRITCRVCATIVAALVPHYLNQSVNQVCLMLQFAALAGFRLYIHTYVHTYIYILKQLIYWPADILYVNQLYMIHARKI